LHHAYVLQYRQAYAYLEEAIQLLEHSQAWVERAQAQIMLAAIDYRQGHYQKSALLHEQARGVFKEAGESWWYLLSLINLARTYLPLGKFQEVEALCQEGFQLLETGDLRLELPLRIQYAYALYLQHDYARAENFMLDNLQLSYQFRNDRTTANILTDLSMVMLDTDRVELAEKYLQESIKLLSDFGESDDLAFALIHVGKCFLARSQLEAARQTFQHVIRIGQTLNMYYFVYWGMVNIARANILEGQAEKALEIMRVLQDCPVEYKLVQDEGNRLLADLQALLPKEQVEALMKQGNGKISADQAAAAALAHALEHETG
jgi:tetratricopeptide (TPR) repeat protein